MLHWFDSQSSLHGSTSVYGFSSTHRTFRKRNRTSISLSKTLSAKIFLGFWLEIFLTHCLTALACTCVSKRKSWWRKHPMVTALSNSGRRRATMFPLLMVLDKSTAISTYRYNRCSFPGLLGKRRPTRLPISR